MDPHDDKTKPWECLPVDSKEKSPECFYQSFHYRYIRAAMRSGLPEKVGFAGIGLLSAMASAVPCPIRNGSSTLKQLMKMSGMSRRSLKRLALKLVEEGWMTKDRKEHGGGSFYSLKHPERAAYCRILMQMTFLQSRKQKPEPCHADL